MKNYITRCILIVLLTLVSSLALAKTGPNVIGGLEISPIIKDIPDAIATDADKATYQYKITNPSSGHYTYRIENTSTEATAQFVQDTGSTACLAGAVIHELNPGASCTFTVSVTPPSTATPNPAPVTYQVMRLETAKEPSGVYWNVIYATLPSSTTPVQVQIEGTLLQDHPGYQAPIGFNGAQSYGPVNITVDGKPHNFGRVKPAAYTVAPVQIIVGSDTYQLQPPQSSGIIVPAQSNIYQVTLTYNKITPPEPIPVTVTISGDLSKDAPTTVVDLEFDGLQHYGPVAITANNKPQNFTKVIPGNYTVAPSSVTVKGTEYDLQSPIVTVPTGEKSYNATLQYNKAGPPPHGGTVPGWPNYLAMGAVTNADATAPGQLQGRLVDAIFKYSGDNGNGDPGKITFPIYTANTNLLAQELTTLNHHYVKPVMVDYTAQMSGGTSFGDFDDNYYITTDATENRKLTKHFVTLMLDAQILQLTAKNPDSVGSIVLNPDLLGMIQQNHLYDPATHQLMDNSKTPPTPVTINVQAAVARAYWFVTTPHDWAITYYDQGKPTILKITQTLPAQILLNVMAGDYKSQDIYSAWDIKNGWETEAERILATAPSDYSSAAIPTFENSFNGWVQANNWAIKALGPNVTFGWQSNVWNVNSANWVHNDWTTDEIAANQSNPTISLWNQIQVYNGQYKPDFLVFDKYEMDEVPGAAGMGYVWNARDWNNYLTYVHQMSTGFNKIPVMLWQIPGGHLQVVNDVDSRNSHASTSPDFVFGATLLAPGLANLKPYILQITLPADSYQCGSACGMAAYLTMNSYNWHNDNLSSVVSSNVFAILWGGGNTTSVGTFPFDDGGWLSSKINTYQQKPTPLKPSDK